MSLQHGCLNVSFYHRKVWLNQNWNSGDKFWVKQNITGLHISMYNSKPWLLVKISYTSCNSHAYIKTSWPIDIQTSLFCLMQTVCYKICRVVLNRKIDIKFNKILCSYQTMLDQDSRFPDTHKQEVVYLLLYSIHKASQDYGVVQKM